MPMKPPTFRPKHQPKRVELRGTAAERGYDAAWRRFRLWFLSQPGNQVCCFRDDPRHKHECSLAATIVDHKTPLNHGGERLDATNCRPVCSIAHQRLTDNLKKCGVNELPGLPVGGWA